MPETIHTYDKRNDTHVIGDVDTDHWGPAFLVPYGMVMCGRPEGGDPWDNQETTAHDCGDRHWSTVHDEHFGFPIGRKLEVAVYSGPIGDEYEGHISGSIRLWYKSLAELSEAERRDLQAKAPTHP